MIIEKKWNQILTNKPQNLFSNVYTLLAQIDSKLGTELGITTNNLYTLMNEIESSYLSANSLWEELPLFMSSYKLQDKRVWYKINQKLLEYCGFYQKILTDKGVSRRIVTASNFANNGSGSSDVKDINSTTPQYTGLYDNTSGEISNSAFEQAIGNYASDLSKSKSTSTKSESGSSGTTITGSTWEEALKNLKYVYFNELVDFISNIPNMIYSYYSLETMPTPRLICEYIKNVKATYKLENE